MDINYKLLHFLTGTCSCVGPPVCPSWHTAPCSPEEAHRGAGHPPAACGHNAEQICPYSHREAHGAAIDEPWRRHSPLGSLWSSAWKMGPMLHSHTGRVAACGKATQDQEGWHTVGRSHVEQRQRMTMKEQQGVMDWPHSDSSFPCTPWEEEVEEARLQRKSF